MNVQRYTCLITTVDPTTSVVGFVTKGDAQERRATILATAIASRWPIEGETWVVRNENGSWYLDSPVPSSYAAVNPGDAIINSPTGQVHVKGSSDGSTDFSFANDTYLRLANPVSRAMDYGNGSVAIVSGQTVSAATVVSHSLGKLPSVVLVTGHDFPGAVPAFETYNWTSTNFTTYGEISSAPTTGTSVNFAWLAIG